MSVDRIHGPAERRRRAERREYWLMFCLVYPLSLAAVAIRRLAHLGRHSASAEPKRSIFGEARVAVASSIPFAFM
jgi:hypothetical protein